MQDELERALALLGPLEQRVMRTAWTQEIAQPFTVRDMQSRMPELAYTTVMTTLRRLADKGLLRADGSGNSRAYEYAPAGGPADFLASASEREAREVVERYGEAALAAFAARLEELPPEQRERLERLRQGWRY